MDPSSEQRHELFVQLLARHEPEVRAFVRASLPGPEEVAEVMQNASLVAWRKFSQLDDPEEAFGKWLCVIARFEVLKFRRGKARDRLVLDEDLVETLAEEGIEETAERRDWLVSLEVCLGKLKQGQRQLILEAYRPGSSIKEMAQEAGRSADALYQQLRRIRLDLAQCIEVTRKKEQREG